MSFPSFFALLFAGAPLWRRRRSPHWLPALALALAGLLGSGLAQATVYTFNGNPVDTCTLSAKLYTCPNPAYLDWDDAVVIGSGYTLKVTNNVTVTYNQGLSMQPGAKLIVTGNLNIKGINPPNLKVADGSSIEVGGTFSMGDLRQSLSADVAANAIHLGTDAVTINGNLTSKTSIAIGSYATINGNVTGTVVTTASPVTINGKVTATSYFSLASGSKVTGSVDTGSLVLESSDALIDGPAWVNTARLEWHGRITGTLYCKNGTSKNKCDCVTNNSGYAVNSANGLRCESGAAPKGLHRFLITHDGEADTCLPEKITVTACANAACTAPHYAGAVTARVLGHEFTIAENAGAAVLNLTRIAAGSVTLDVTGSTITPASERACYRSSNNTNSCDMNFAGGTKLKLSVPAHAAGAGIQGMLQAVKANDDNSACVAAFQGQVHDVSYTCSYGKPKTGTLSPALDNKPLACSPTAKLTINTGFDANGSARLPFSYADAGEIVLGAVIDGAKGKASGEGSAVTAPASFRIEPPAGPIRAGADFALRITARNTAGAVTPNFDTAALNNALAVKHDVTLAVDCHRQGGIKGSLTPVSPAFSAGVAAVTATWSDVGNIDLGASLPDFLGAGVGATGSTSTAAAGQCSGAVGPFIPAWFYLELVSPRAFYYAGEPIPLRVSAMNKAGAVTVNYSAQRGLSELLALAAHDKTGAAFAQAPGGLSPAIVEADKFTDGVAQVQPSYVFTTAPHAPTQLRLRVRNGKAAPLDVSSAAPAAAEDAAMPLVRSGRLRIGNRFGGLKTTLAIPVTAEYWTGKSWLLNSDDNHTVIPHNAFILKPAAEGMTVTRSFAANPFRLAGGAGSFDLRVSAGGPGPVDIAINLGDGLMDNTCIGNAVGTGMASTSARIPWLRPYITGCNPAQFRDPSARASFGVYTPENRRIIHVREVFN